jgi:hypothetical protein
MLDNINRNILNISKTYEYTTNEIIKENVKHVLDIVVNCSDKFEIYDQLKKRNLHSIAFRVIETKIIRIFSISGSESVEYAEKITEQRATEIQNKEIKHWKRHQDMQKEEDTKLNPKLERNQPSRKSIKSKREFERKDYLNLTKEDDDNKENTNVGVVVSLASDSFQTDLTQNDHRKSSITSVSSGGSIPSSSSITSIPDPTLFLTAKQKAARERAAKAKAAAAAVSNCGEEMILVKEVSRVNAEEHSAGESGNEIKANNSSNMSDSLSVKGRCNIL